MHSAATQHLSRQRAICPLISSSIAFLPLSPARPPQFSNWPLPLAAWLLAILTGSGYISTRVGIWRAKDSLVTGCRASPQDVLKHRRPNQRIYPFRNSSLNLKMARLACGSQIRLQGPAWRDCPRISVFLGAPQCGPASSMCPVTVSDRV